MPQRPGLSGADYTAIMFPTNTGLPSGFDLDNNGRIVSEATDDIMEQRAYGGDCWGFGVFPGQYGFAILVRPEIAAELDDVRSFQQLLWNSMPGALAPVDPQSGEAWYSDEEWAELRLSSKNHVALPVVLPSGERVHLLVSHPTPPAFDGPEARNQKRNHDEIRLWADFLDGADYVVDDQGAAGGLEDGQHFVIMGDQNADPDEGSSIDDPIRYLPLFASAHRR